MTRIMMVLVCLAGCSTTGDSKSDDTTTTDDTTSETDTTADTTETTDTTDTTSDVATDACNTDNEACEPGVRGCGGEGSDMLPGANCLACHSGGGRLPTWTAAGTIYVDADGTKGLRGAIIRITDSTGTTEELTSYRSGNFFTDMPLVPPLSVEVEVDGVTRAMGRQVDTGACNTCHTCEGEAQGKLHGP